ncbi:MAG: cobalamin B12-binding domain-containing protein [Planctomycetes bacterium]|nr:cobalamin B12-binding domain-containing protein [Planctomycetota bacterium]
MDEGGRRIGKLLDAGLAALAAGTVVRQREELRERGVRLEPGVFEELVGDTEVRLLQLAEALAVGRPRLFVDHLEWSRSALAARGLGEERLALNLACLRAELERELPPDAAAPVRAVLDEAARCFDRPAPAVPCLLEADVPHRTLLRKLLLCLLEARRQDALDLVLGAVDAGLSVSEVETELLVPVQQEVGAMWQRGELAVHEEHLGSRIVEEALILLRTKMPPRTPNGRTVLVASVQGNLHDIGTRIVADHFELEGWNALRLGANLPNVDLAHAARDFRADLVALSVAMTLSLRETHDVIAGLRAQLGADAPPVLVGGRPFALIDDLWQAVGADGWARDVREAPRAGRALLGLA